jgi:U3 small nucleolar RNA-associated protein 20
VLALLAETLKKGFIKHTETVLRVAKHIMESSLVGVGGSQASSTNEVRSLLWKEAYHSLGMLEKVFLHSPEMYFKRDLEVFSCYAVAL